MRCHCGKLMQDTSGYAGRSYDAALNQQTRLRRCQCGNKRATVELDADVLAELRRKAYVYDAFGLTLGAPPKIEKAPKKDRVGGWSDEEVALLREHYPKLGTAVCKMIGKTKKACETKASRLHLRRIYEGRPKRKAKPEQPMARIEGGAARSVFELAARVADPIGGRAS